MEENQFKCAKCDGVFNKALTEEEAIKEKNELWGDIPLEKCELVCDDCFNEIHPEKNLEIARKAGYKK